MSEVMDGDIGELVRAHIAGRIDEGIQIEYYPMVISAGFRAKTFGFGASGKMGEGSYNWLATYQDMGLVSVEERQPAQRKGAAEKRAIRNFVFNGAYSYSVVIDTITAYYGAFTASI